MSQADTAGAAAPGIPTAPSISIRGKRCELRPLTFGAWKRTAHRVQQIAEGTSSSETEVMDAIADVLLASLQRGHPDITREQLEDELDWDTAQQLYVQVLQSSLPAVPPGEMPGASRSGASTGTP